jgi:hypothetical protein
MSMQRGGQSDPPLPIRTCEGNPFHLFVAQLLYLSALAGAAQDGSAAPERLLMRAREYHRWERSGVSACRERNHEEEI